MEFFLELAYWFVTLVLTAGVLTGFWVGAYYVVRESPEKKADWFFGFLIIAMAFTLLHNLFVHRNFFEKHPAFLFLPVYFTLSFGPLLFFFVKMKLYPGYLIRWTDAKHMILPVGQFLYFCYFFVQPPAVKMHFGRQLLSPFYGGVEMMLYIGTFWAYHYFAYRYVIAKIRNQQHPVSKRMSLQVAWLKRMVKVLFLLFFFNAIYIVVDFLSFELISLNLHKLKGFDYLGSLSFASLLFWLVFNGWVMRRV